MRSLFWALAALLLLSPPAHADDEAATAAARASLERIQALRVQRPGDGLLAYYEALVRVQLGERDAAMAELRGLRGRRLGLVPMREFGFEGLWGDAEFQALRDQLLADEEATPPAPVAFVLKDAALIPEGIAFDAPRRRFYVGSIAQRKIVASDARGRVRDFSRPSDRLDAVLGLAVDARRHQLHAVSTNGFEASARTLRRNAVLRYDLRSGRLAERIDVPDAQQLNDIAIAADGTQYATDSPGGALWRRKPGEPAFTAFVPSGSLPGANGIALSPEGTIYVAMSTGIARVDPASAGFARLPQPDSVVTGGIDGLYWHEGDLVGVQNVTHPGRVIRIRLAEAGRRIAGIAVLQSHHHPALAEPTTGAIVGQTLHLVANSYVAHYQPDGSIRDAQQLKPTVILAVPLKR
ncbi:MAG TPA: hypothetical protein VGE16_02085 [Albitalea sp.]